MDDAATPPSPSPAPPVKPPPIHSDALSLRLESFPQSTRELVKEFVHHDRDGGTVTAAELSTAIKGSREELLSQKLCNKRLGAGFVVLLVLFSGLLAALGGVVYYVVTSTRTLTLSGDNAIVNAIPNSPGLGELAHVASFAVETVVPLSSATSVAELDALRSVSIVSPISGAALRVNVDGWGVAVLGGTRSVYLWTSAGLVQVTDAGGLVPVPPADVDAVNAALWAAATEGSVGAVGEDGRRMLQGAGSGGAQGVVGATTSLCPAGQLSATGQTPCTNCPTGLTSMMGATSCAATASAPCAVGFFSTSGFAPCSACPLRLTTPSTGAVSCSTPAVPQAGIVYDVIVVGGGAAGIGAAVEAKAKGLSVLLIEGRTRMNGRVWTSRDWGYAMDLGASWLHGILGSSTSSCPAAGCTNTCPVKGCVTSCSDALAASDSCTGVNAAGGYPNYIYRAAVQYGIKTVPTDYDKSELFNSDGSINTNAAAIDTAWTAYESKLNTVVNNLASDAPLSTSIATANTQTPYSTSTAAVKAGIDFSVITNIAHELAASTSQLSSWWYNDGFNLNGVDHIAPGGMAQILDAIFANQAQGTTVLLGYNVTAVSVAGCVSNGGATVTANGPSGPVTFRGRSVVVTVPLGVLKKGTIAFTPALPARITTAISRLGMGVLNKIAYEFASTPNNANANLWPTATASNFVFNRMGSSACLGSGGGGVGMLPSSLRLRFSLCVLTRSLSLAPTDTPFFP